MVVGTAQYAVQHTAAPIVHITDITAAVRCVAIALLHGTEHVIQTRRGFGKGRAKIIILISFIVYRLSLSVV